MKKVAIIGVGLIGGSLGMALKVSRKGYHITGIGRDKAKLLTAKKLRAVDEFTIDLKNGVRDADIIVICTPVNTIAGIVKIILPHVKEGAVITDAGSVKGAVLRDVSRVMKKESRNINFVGAHPLAGLEKTGVQFARRDLFKDAYVVVSQLPGTPDVKISEINKMWSDTGAKITAMDAKEHDRVVSSSSHLPHVLAFALCGAVGNMEHSNPVTSKLIAGSFKDVTRIADSNPGDWAAICNANNTELSKAINDFVTRLRFIRKNLVSKEKLEKIFTENKSARQKLLQINTK